MISAIGIFGTKSKKPYGSFFTHFFLGKKKKKPTTPESVNRHLGVRHSCCTLWGIKSLLHSSHLPRCLFWTDISTTWAQSSSFSPCGLIVLWERCSPDKGGEKGMVPTIFKLMGGRWSFWVGSCQYTKCYSPPGDKLVTLNLILYEAVCVHAPYVYVPFGFGYMCSICVFTCVYIYIYVTAVSPAGHLC